MAENTYPDVRPVPEAARAPARGDLLDDIRGYLAAQRDIPPEQVQENTLFMDDLAIDSLDLAAMALSLEDKYGVRLDDGEVLTIRTVSEALDLVLDTLARGTARHPMGPEPR